MAKARIFICYRREDSGPAAGRIYDRLAMHFGRGQVFMDVDDIPLGVDWRDWLDRQVRGADLVLAVIGRDWLRATDAGAVRRLLSDELGLAIRLPIEWEWERVARGTDGREFPWGDGYRTGFANIDETISNAGLCQLGQTTAVGMYPQGASPEGVLDLAGNVWEWCLNEYDDPERIPPEGNGRSG